MQLKLNSSALKMLVSDNGSRSGAILGGLSDVSISGLNDGVDIGSGNYIAPFMKGMVGTGYARPYVRGLFLMKGTMPTQAEFDAGITNGLVNITALNGIFRYSDLLVYYQAQTYSPSLGSQVCSFLPVVASATGAATWFMFGSFGARDATYTTLASATYLVAGSITSIGGGGDIEMLNTAITSGVTYRVPQYELRFPSKFSV
jgi:hypothetical protein